MKRFFATTPRGTYHEMARGVFGKIKIKFLNKIIGNLLHFDLKRYS
jgi:hypothetical protein